MFTQTAKYLSGAQDSVASNTSTYLFSAESATNASIVDTLSGVENITGTNLIDYIVGSATANTIIGAAGIDYITTGTGKDVVDLAAIAVAGSVAGGDVITDFTVGAGLEGDVIRALDTTYAWDFGTTNGAVVLVTGANLVATDTANANATVHTLSTNVATHTAATYQAGTSTITQLEGTIATALGTALTADYGGKHVLVAVDDGTDTMIVRVSDGGTNGIAAAELSLLAILEGVADATTLVAENFACA